MISFILPGKSAFTPKKPLGKLLARGTAQLPGPIGELQKISRIGSASPASAATPAASTTAQKQTRLLRRGRPGAVTGTTAKLGGTQVRRPGASVLG